MVDPKKIDGELAVAIGDRSLLQSRAKSLQYSIDRPMTYVYPANKKEILQQELDEVKASIANLDAEIKSLNAQYTGWTRAYLVMNSNGHIHKSTNCSTCFETTQYYWMTDLSGDNEWEIAEKAGEKACTVCYADAPSAVFLMKSQLEHPDVKRAREEREAKKAAREAKRLATGIWNLDGTPLKVKSYYDSRYTQEVKTERTASTMVVDAMVSIAEWISRLTDERYTNAPAQVAHYRENIEMILEALAVKRGTSVETERAIAQAKADKKIEQSRKATERWYAEHPEYQR
jgi:hypothetical protein